RRIDRTDLFIPSSSSHLSHCGCDGTSAPSTGATLLRSTRSRPWRRVVKRNSHEVSYVYALAENAEFLGSRRFGFKNRNPFRWEMIGQCRMRPSGAVVFRQKRIG